MLLAVPYGIIADRRGRRFVMTLGFISFAAAIQITVLCTILPAAHAWLGRVYPNPDTANLVLSKASILFLILGPVVIGFADKAAGIYIGKLFESLLKSC